MTMDIATVRSSRSDSPGTSNRKAVPASRQQTALLGFLLVIAAPGMASSADNDAGDGFLPQQRTVSTVPSNGDANPYGVAFVEQGFAAGSGPLKSGDILVSNFNNSSNLQGLGTTIVDVPEAGGAATLFFQGSSPLGLTTALGLLRKGFVVVGNGPTADGTSATASAGSLLVIDNRGNLIQTITDANIQYPWDMALVDLGNHATAFVSNALNGTVARLEFSVGSAGLTLQNSTVIGSGYMHRGDPAALFVAPTGLVYDAYRDVLYVASTEDNEVFALRDAGSRKSAAGTGSVIYQDSVHLHGPLGMAMAPNGHLLVSNSDVINGDPNQPSEIVEFTINGKFVRQLSVDPAQGGSFGLAVDTDGDNATFAAVDDNTASLTVWQLRQP
jgi:hypothetical protein